MHYLIFILLILMSTYSQIINTPICGDCNFHQSSRSCEPRANWPQQKCNPETLPNICPYGCKPSTNKSYVYETNKYIFPLYELINLHLPNYYENNDCTNSSKFHKCSCKCEYDTSIKHCIPMSTEHFCGQITEWNCPVNCRYDGNIHGCVPVLNIYTCKLDKTSYPYRCPTGCTYDTYKNKCISTNGNTVCDLQKNILCNAKCNSGICCVRKDNQCEPKNIDEMNICEQIIRGTCPDRYFFDNDIPYCTQFNRYDICKISNITIEYPSRISDKIKDIHCTYFTDLDCKSMTYGKINTCPLSCKLDIYKNKCTYNNNIPCGAIDLKCPIGCVIDSTGSCNCLPERNHIRCPENYILLNISTISGYAYDCGPKWYYG